MSDEENDCMGTPPEIREAAKKITEELLPKKSAEVYQARYNQFKDWAQANNIQAISENVLLGYFSELITEKGYKSSTLWTVYSILRTTLINNDNVNIAHYAKLRSLLKKQTVGYQPKKSKVCPKSA